MALEKKADRLQKIAAGALEAFSEKGYRLTQVADIARRAGVAPGTIYLFAASKEDLFWLALKFAMAKPLEAVACRPISANEMRSEFSLDSSGFTLRGRLDAGNLPPLETVLRDHWAVVSHAAAAITLVERCASDWPELADAFYGDLRSNVVRDLADYLVAGAEAGICRRVPHPALAARIIIETIAWFAMHRLRDADGRHMNAEAAREATVDALLHAYRLEENA